MSVSTPPPIRPAARITVLGIGADGWAGLGERQREMVSTATVLIGGQRHLGLVPEVAGQRRESWPSPLREGLPGLLASLPAAGSVVALASGDPLVSGIGTTLLALCEPGTVCIEPAISSVSLARARMGWSAESTAVVTVVGRDPSLVLRELADGHRMLVLSADQQTPNLVAGLLLGAGYGDSELTVLGDVGSADESRTCHTAADWVRVQPEVSRLNVLAVELSGPAGLGWAPGLPDSAYDNDGQLTKRDLRASALARLAPTPGQHLWDVGAGAGSIGIEWMRAHPTCRATAIEADPERAHRIVGNARRLGVPGLTVRNGRAPAALAGLDTPDAVFVGGGATRPGVIEACLGALGPSGRIVVHGVTVETEALLAKLHASHGGELTRISVETSDRIGSMTGWKPARTVTQWAR